MSSNTDNRTIMKTTDRVSDKIQENWVAILTSILANEMTLYVKLKKANWNEPRDRHEELHDLYKTHYKNLDEEIDKIATLISKMERHAIGTMFEFSQLSFIEEKPGDNFSTTETIKELVNDHKSIISQMRKYIENCYERNSDTTKSQLLAQVIEQHEIKIRELEQVTIILQE